jgi:rod shape-determining protein MreC
LFTWNARTGYLDTVAERTGLEFMGYVLSPFIWIGDQCTDLWRRYIALIDIAEENALLRDELRRAHLAANHAAEEKAELERLRRLLQVEALRERPGFAARVIAKRFGPEAVLKTFTVNKGFLDGAVVGTPVVTEQGVVGRVLRAAPHAATVIMLTDPGCRLAVITRESRTPGILSGALDGRLEVAYVSQTAQIAPGDILVTSGVDGAFPKGLPVGRVTQVMPGNETLFQQVQAQPLVDLNYLEEVVLLQQAEDGAPLLDPLPVAPVPGESPPDMRDEPPLTQKAGGFREPVPPPRTE